MPIVFNLSSWAEKRQPLRAWLVEELWMKYQVPRKIGQGWVEAHQVLPLLDGLNEVAYEIVTLFLWLLRHSFLCMSERRSFLWTLFAGLKQKDID